MNKVLTMNQARQLEDLLWDFLRKDKENKDRRYTGWGIKTKKGLIACIEKISGEGNDHED